MLTLANRKLSKIFKKYPHLKEVHMNDTGKKEQVPPHIILGASDFDEINIESPRVGKLDWTFGRAHRNGMGNDVTR